MAKSANGNGKGNGKAGSNGAEGNGDSDGTISDLAAIDVELAFGIEFERKGNLNVFCPFCEDPESSRSPSCSVSSSGVFSCKACKRSGNAAQFYAQSKNIPLRQAQDQLGYTVGASPELIKKRKERAAKNASKKPVIPLSEQLIMHMHEELMRSTYEIGYLTGKERGLSVATLVDFEVGKDEARITIPLRLSDGSLHGVRRYLPKATKVPKMTSHEGGSGSPVLFPMQRLAEIESVAPSYLVLCEGEWDCMMLWQQGFYALTATAGVGAWEDEWTQHILNLGLPIIIIYDVNDKDDDLGQRVAWERATLLHDQGLQVKVVRLTLPLRYVGGDITNWFSQEGRSASDLKDLIHNTEWFDGVIPTEMMAPSEIAKGIESPRITLHDASLSDYFYKSIRLRCLVAGRISSPYLLPSKVMIETVDSDGNTNQITRNFDPWEGLILSLIRCTATVQQRTIKALAGISTDTPATITVLESLNVEEVFLIPAVDHTVDPGPYVMRQCYYVGHGLKTNQVYDFEGYTLPDPRSQAATHILTKATPSATNIDNFELDGATFERMKKTFSTDNIFDRLEDISTQFANHITRIFGRPDLHIAVDLVFHSPLTFDFDGHRLKKGWLECLVIGDTRTGKGYVTEGLSKHYGVGEVVSGENMSFAGLIGGIQKMGDNWTLVWGKIPLSDRGLVILDECGSLSYDTISRLSRIRSEGVAEITKILTEKTSARTRLIWLSNARPSSTGEPKTMQDYPYGIQAVLELIGATEDVARFDFVLTVAHNEVPSKDINCKRTDELPPLDYTSELCRKLIVWAWSRTPDQIHFEDGVVDYTLKAAQDLGKKFSPSVCLIQSEDVRFKLARIACAAAARTFSTDDGVTLIVKKEHIEFAYNFLHHIYSKPSCGYLQMSTAERERSTLREPAKVIEILSQVGESLADLVGGLLEQSQITARDLCDYAGVDIFQARGIISDLVRTRAVTKHQSYYTKRPAFRSLLQNLKNRLDQNPNHITAMDEEFVRDLEGEPE